MGAAVAETGSQFSERILRLLERVQHRVAKTPAEKEAIYRLRYEAYIRNDLIDPREDERLCDSGYDDDSVGLITSTHIDGELVATVRINIGAGADAALPSQRVFSDVMSPYLHAGCAVADFTRAAARLEASREFPELPYLALRPGYLALGHWDVDFAVATPRPEHSAFYRRIFQFSAWSEARSYPNVAPKVMCLGMDFQNVRDRVEARYPFFRSTAAERETLFGPRPVGEIRLRTGAGRRDLEPRAIA
jgi:hypothetical protein